jgi:hypothetical protein
VRRLIPHFLVFAALIITFLIYRPGLSGSFIFDDTPNILQNSSIAISDLSLESLRQAGLSGASGPLSRPISMASFAINYYLNGFNPFYFKLTNLTIHLLNGIGFFVFTSLLLNFYRRHFQPLLTIQHVSWISLTVATAWLLHPFNLTSVLYIVQRMTSLSAFFSILGLTLFIGGRIRLYEGQRGWFAVLASLMVFTPLATLSKETGALLPLLMLVSEVTLFRFRCQVPAMRRWVITFFTLCVGLPAAATMIYMISHPEWVMSSYVIRDFNLPERLMTEARVVCFYLKQIVLPSSAAMGMFHDDIPISRSLLQPLSTLPAIVGVVALPAIALALRKQAPLLAFGILFFLAGHILESTIFPLEIAHEHRNYLPMYGVVLTMFFYLLHPKHADTLRIRGILAVTFIGLFAFLTLSRAQDWADPFELNSTEVRHHPDSPRDNDELGNVYANFKTQDKASMESYYLAACYYFQKATTLSPSYTNGLFGLIQLSSAREKPIEASWIDELTFRLQHKPFAADTGSYLIALITCRFNETCKLPDEVIENLLDSSLRNPTLVGSNRASVFSAQSYYLVNIKKDYEAGLVAMNHMVDTAPNLLENRLTLIKYLIALKRFPEAKSQIAILQNMDHKKLYVKEVALRKRLLEEHP